MGLLKDSEHLFRLNICKLGSVLAYFKKECIQYLQQEQQVGKHPNILKNILFQPPAMELWWGYQPDFRGQEATKKSRILL